MRTAFQSKLFWTVVISLAIVGAPAAARGQQQAPPQHPPTAPQAQPAPTDGARPAESPLPSRIVVPAGTKLPLVLHNGITTRNSKPGDPVYLETLFPIIQDSRILIPAGSYVSGEIIEAKRPGRVKGRGEVMLRLNTMILPNGYLVNFNAVPENVDTGGNESLEGEGKIKGDSDKASDVGTVVKTTGIGAGVGGLATRTGKGAGIGAGIGAAVGLGAVLLTRGPELELPRGTTLDVVLERPLYLDTDRVSFTDPGRASTLAGPTNRQPQRNKIPF